ncbi:unnamed protein product, partial [Notodromas monacha]
MCGDNMDVAMVDVPTVADVPDAGVLEVLLEESWQFELEEPILYLANVCAQHCTVGNQAWFICNPQIPMPGCALSDYWFQFAPAHLPAILHGSHGYGSHRSLPLCPSCRLIPDLHIGSVNGSLAPTGAAPFGLIPGSDQKNDAVLANVNPIRDGRNLALLVVSITRTYRVTSVTTTPVTSIAKCYRPTTIAICSKRKRDILVISGPEGAEEEMDAYFKQLQLQPGEAMEVVPVDLADEPVELSSSVDLVGEVSSSVYDTHGFDLDLANVRHRRLFRPQSFVSSTTLTTTSTFTSTFWGSTIETIAYQSKVEQHDHLSRRFCGKGMEQNAGTALQHSTSSSKFLRNMFKAVVTNLVFLATFVAVKGNEKTWRDSSRFDDANAWQNGVFPEPGDTVILPSWEAVFWPQNLVVNVDIVFPSTGAVVLTPGSSQVFSLGSHPLTSSSNNDHRVHNVSKRFPARQRPEQTDDWFDPRNWGYGFEFEGAVAGLNPVPEANRVPCTGDMIRFPGNATFRVNVSEDVRVGAVKLGAGDLFGTTDKFSDYRNTPLGLLQIQGPGKISLKTCRDPVSQPECTCQNARPEILRKICRYVPSSVCEAYSQYCTDPVRPVGSCCPVCGSIVTGALSITATQNWDLTLERIERIRNVELANDEHLNAFYAVTHDRALQLVVVHSEGDILAAETSARNIETFLRIESLIEASQIFAAELTASSGSASSALIGVFAFIFIIGIIFGSLVCVKKRRLFHLPPVVEHYVPDVDLGDWIASVERRFHSLRTREFDTGTVSWAKLRDGGGLLGAEELPDDSERVGVIGAVGGREPVSVSNPIFEAGFVDVPVSENIPPDAESSLSKKSPVSFDKAAGDSSEFSRSFDFIEDWSVQVNLNLDLKTCRPGIALFLIGTLIVSVLFFITDLSFNVGFPLMSEKPESFLPWLLSSTKTTKQKPEPEAAKNSGGVSEDFLSLRRISNDVSVACRHFEIPVWPKNREWHRRETMERFFDCKNNASHQPWVVMEKGGVARILQPGNVACNFTEIVFETDYEFLNTSSESPSEYYELVHSDTVKVQCKNTNNDTWSDVLLGVRKNERTSEIPEELKMTSNHSPVKNVIVWMFDAISRNAFTRNLPKTWAFMEKEANGVLFKGFNVHGFNSMPNIIPFWTGKLLSEWLPKHGETEVENLHERLVILDKFGKAGFVTAYYEDSQYNSGYDSYLIKDAGLRGFKKPPAHYYSRVFMKSRYKLKKDPGPLCIGNKSSNMVPSQLPVGQTMVTSHKPAGKCWLVQPPARAVLGLANPQPTELWYGHPILRVLGTKARGHPIAVVTQNTKNWVTIPQFGGLGIGKTKDCPGWWLDQPAFTSWLHAQDYIKELWELHENERKFFFINQVSYTHDSLTDVRMIDEEVRDFLKHWLSSIRNDTLVIVMSDHGNHLFKAINLRTVEGYFEQKMPLVYFMPPFWMNSVYPDKMSALKTNAAARLTTHMDLHETFLHLLNFSEERKPAKFGQSLFAEIPKSRTCSDVGIQPGFCACNSPKPIDVQVSEVKKWGEMVFEMINQKLHKALLQLPKISRKSENSTENSTADFLAPTDVCIEWSLVEVNQAWLITKG